MKIAYSDYLKSHIICVFKLSNKIWWFKRCDKNGFCRYDEVAQLSGFKHNHFEWKNTPIKFTKGRLKSWVM